MPKKVTIILSETVGKPPAPPSNTFYVYLDTDDVLKGINDRGKIFIFGLVGVSPSGFVVGQENGAPFNVIQEAIDAANAEFLADSIPKVVVIRPGTYTEDITLKEGVMLMGLNPGPNVQFSPSLPTPAGRDLPATQIVGTLLTSESSSTHISNITFLSDGANAAIKGLNGPFSGVDNVTVQFVRCAFLNDPANPVLPVSLIAVIATSDAAVASVNLGFDNCYIDFTNVSSANPVIHVESSVNAAAASTANVSFKNSVINGVGGILLGDVVSLKGDNALCSAAATFDSCQLNAFQAEVSSDVGVAGDFSLTFLDCEIFPQSNGFDSVTFIKGSTQATAGVSLTVRKSTVSTGSGKNALFTNYVLPAVGAPSKDTLRLEDVVVAGNAWFPPYQGFHIPNPPFANITETHPPIYVRPGTFTIAQALQVAYVGYEADLIQREVVLAPGLYEENDLIVYPVVTLRGELPFDPWSVFSEQEKSTSNTLSWSSVSPEVDLPDVAIIRNNTPEANQSCRFLAKDSASLFPTNPQTLNVSDILFLAVDGSGAGVLNSYQIESQDWPAGNPFQMNVSFHNCGFGMVPNQATVYLPLIDIALDVSSSARFNNCAIGLVFASDVTSSFIINSNLVSYRRRAAASFGYLQFNDCLIHGGLGQFACRALITQDYTSENGTLGLSCSNTTFFGRVRLLDPGSGGIIELRSCDIQYGDVLDSAVQIQTASAAHATAPKYLITGGSLRQPLLFGTPPIFPATTPLIFPIDLTKSLDPTTVVISNLDLPVTKCLTDGAAASIFPPPGNQVILVDTTTTAYTLNLPDPSLGDLTAVNSSMIIRVVDIGGNAALENITINNRSGVLIKVLNSDDETVTLAYTNTAPLYWTVVD